MIEEGPNPKHLGVLELGEHGERGLRRGAAGLGIRVPSSPRQRGRSPEVGFPPVAATVLTFRYRTVNGRIMSLSSCSTMWQW